MTILSQSHVSIISEPKSESVNQTNDKLFPIFSILSIQYISRAPQLRTVQKYLLSFTAIFYTLIIYYTLRPRCSIYFLEC